MEWTPLPAANAGQFTVQSRNHFLRNRRIEQSVAVSVGDGFNNALSQPTTYGPNTPNT